MDFLNDAMFVHTSIKVSLEESAAILLTVSGISDLSAALVDESANKLSQVVEDATRVSWLRPS